MAFSCIKPTTSGDATGGGGSVSANGMKIPLPNKTKEQVKAPEKNKVLAPYIEMFSNLFGLNETSKQHLIAGMEGALVGISPTMDKVAEVAQDQVKKVAGIDQAALIKAITPELSIFKNLSMCGADHNSIRASTVGICTPQTGMALAIT